MIKHGQKWFPCHTISKTPLFISFVMGVAVSLLSGWLEWGCAKVPMFEYIVKILLGFSCLFCVLMILLPFCALKIFCSKRRISYIVYGNFNNCFSLLYSTFNKGIGFFFGAFPVAMICWRITGSIFAFKTGVLAGFLVVEFLVVWIGFVFLEREFLKRVAVRCV